MSSNGADRKMAVYIGHDSRQPLSYNVMRYSVESRASKPVGVNGLFIDQLPITRTGATDFTYSRFLVPYLMDYEGIGIFCDEDMVVTGDIWELFEFAENIPGDWDVAVMKDQPKFEWSSVMVFNNKNCTNLTPEYIDNETNSCMSLEWAANIADIPSIWNHCVGMMEPKEAKLYHYTQGIPFWPECRGLPEDEYWYEAFEEMKKSVDWIDLHSGTKHFGPVMSRFLYNNYGITIQKK